MPATKWTHAAIMEQLPAIIADCLGVDEADVLPHSHFKDDLGGESIDDLDLAFRCEKAFGCKAMFQPLMELANAPRDPDNHLTDAAWQTFRAKCPGVAHEIAAHARPPAQDEELRRLYTTEMIARFVLDAIP